jgi:hypothetical protein
MISWEPLTDAGCATPKYADQPVLSQRLSARVSLRQRSIFGTGSFSTALT